MTTQAEYVERFREAESLGLIDEWLYSYSPENTTTDTRYVFRPIAVSGTTTLFHSECETFLSTLGL